MEERLALITGGSRGIGRQIALDLAREKINIVINYRQDEAAAKEVEELCRSYGVKALALQGDVSKGEDVARIFREIRERFKTLDILVNNAGITRDNLLLRMSEEDFKDVLDINLTSSFYTMKEAVGLMSRQKSGVIINIASIVGLRGNPGQINYAASKAGLIGMTKTLAKEMASRNIRVNVVAPGFIETEMTGKLSEDSRERLRLEIPLKSLGQAEDVSNLVSFLASPRASYITGQVISVDGGMNI